MKQKWLTAGLALWGVGALSVEALASAGLILCCAIALGCGLWRHRFDATATAKRWALAWGPLLAFVAWGVLGPLAGGHPPSGTGLARLMDWAAIPLGAWAWTQVDGGSRRRVGWILAGTFALSCALAGFQHVGWWPSPEAFEPFAWTRFPFHRVYEPVPGAPGRFMAGGLLSHRLKFAHTGGLAVLTALILGLHARRWARGVALATAVLGAGAVIAFPFARAATFALLTCVPVALILSLRRRRWALLVGAAVLVVGGAAVALRPAARERFVSSFTAQGSGDRSFLLDAGARAVEQHPLTGVGPGRFKIRDFAAPDAPVYVVENTGKAHNQLLSVAAEMGLPGLALFCVALVALALKMRPVTPARAVGLIALAHFLLLSLAHDPLYQAPYSMALSLALAFGASDAGSAATPSRAGADAC